MTENIQTVVEDKKDVEEFAILCMMGIRNIYTFYARAWNFR